MGSRLGANSSSAANSKLQRVRPDEAKAKAKGKARAAGDKDKDMGVCGDPVLSVLLESARRDREKAQTKSRLHLSTRRPKALTAAPKKPGLESHSDEKDKEGGPSPPESPGPKRAHRRPKLRPSWQTLERDKRQAARRAYMASIAQVRRHVFLTTDVWESMLRYDSAYTDTEDGHASVGTGASAGTGDRCPLTGLPPSDPRAYPGGGCPTEDRTFEDFMDFLSWSSA